MEALVFTMIIFSVKERTRLDTTLIKQLFWNNSILMYESWPQDVRAKTEADRSSTAQRAIYWGLTVRSLVLSYSKTKWIHTIWVYTVARTKVISYKPEWTGLSSANAKESGTLLVLGPSCKAPHTILMVLSIKSLPWNCTHKKTTQGYSGAVVAVMSQDGCSQVKLNLHNNEASKRK
jgi:hypothetical protein